MVIIIILENVDDDDDDDDNPVLSCRQSFDTEELNLSSSSSPPLPLIPLSAPVAIFGQVEFSRQPPGADSRHLMKPLAEKLRRVSTGSMRIEVSGEKSPLSARLSDTSGAMPSGFRKCKNLLFLLDRIHYAMYTIYNMYCDLSLMYISTYI